MRRREATPVRRVMVACLSAAMATIGLGGSLLAQSPSPLVEPSTLVETVVLDPFPSAEEISDILGVHVEARGIEDGLSQIWEGTIIDWQSLPSAQLQFYFSPTDEPQVPLTGAIIDVAHFGSVEDAVQSVDDVVFVDGPPGFVTDLPGDYVATASFESDDGFGGSYIFLREGPVVVAVTVIAAGTTEMEAISEAVGALVLGRLHEDN
jgi:hypothetical protein